MSVDIDWDAITSGPDGAALAEKIRDFVHDKFQQITLPRFINSVQVHSFDFGSVCPHIEIKDFCDPLPDFYEDDESEEGLQDDLKDDRTLRGSSHEPSTHINQDRLQRLQDQILHSQIPRDANCGPQVAARQDSFPPPFHSDLLAGHFPRSATPGIPGGTSNIGYFNYPLSGLSGTQTPLAAVASGTPFAAAAWNHDLHGSSTHPHSNLAAAFSPVHEHLQERQRSTSPTRPSTANTIPSQPSPFTPGSPQSQRNLFHAAEKVSDTPDLDDTAPLALSPRMPPPSQPEDLQVVARVSYAGDIKLTLTAEILLDYPMPSFVGIPLQLSITGLTFDGVAIVAHIRRRMHFCFLAPEDAETLLAADVFNTEDGSPTDTMTPSSKAAGASSQPPPPSPPFKKAGAGAGSVGGLLQEIKVESEIGRKGEGKQSLRNVGKVEKFVLEQVRRIFEEEFVFPSFWTFLV